MFSSDVSWWGVVFSTVIFVAVTFCWYSPYLFGKKWLELTRVQDIEAGNMGVLVVLTFLAAFLMSYVLADIASFLHVENFGEGALLGFWVWLGFIATIHLMAVLYAKKPLTLYFIDVGAYLVSFVLMGGVIGFFA